MRRLRQVVKEVPSGPSYHPELFQFADKLDGKAMLFRDGFSMSSDAVTEKLSKLGIIEDADALKVRGGGHAGGITEPRKRDLEDDPIKTGEC